MRKKRSADDVQGSTNVAGGRTPGATAPPEWQWRERPPALFRRFQFENYGATRAFLDALAELSKQDGYYPDISFGTTYANVTVHARDGAGLQHKDFEFAARINELTDLSRGVKQ